MYVRQFESLPRDLQNEAVRPYFEYLNKKRFSLAVKRGADIVVALLVLAVTSPAMLLAALGVALTSPGPLFYCQTRVGLYGKPFLIYKFRTMQVNADQTGAAVTVGERDPRITPFGRFLRATRIDEFPQMINVLKGDMSIIGARPEVPRYVALYTDEMLATLLLPPASSGVASIAYRHENALLAGKEDPERYYIETILPDKMALNLDYLRRFSLWNDLRLMGQTLLCVFHK